MTDTDTWETQDGYKLSKDLDKGDIKDFFGGGRRARDSGDDGKRSDQSGGTSAGDEHGVQRTDGKDKHVPEPA